MVERRYRQTTNRPYKAINVVKSRVGMCSGRRTLTSVDSFPAWPPAPATGSELHPNTSVLILQTEYQREVVFEKEGHWYRCHLLV
jgi:hypothetical protein